MRTWRVYVMLSMASLRSQMQYRAGFFSMVFGLVLVYGGQFLNLRWLTLRFPTLNGWALRELILLYALSIMAWGFTVSFFFHLHSFEEEVREGGYDRFLVRPLNPFLQAVSKHSPIGGTGQLLFAIIAFLWATGAAGVEWTGQRVAFVVLAIVGGTMILSAAIITVGALSFWTTRSNMFYWALIFPARHLTYYPISIYPRPVQALLTFVVPFAFINFYPSQALLGKDQLLFHPSLPYLTPIVGLLAFVGAYRLWMTGTNRYTSTGN